LVIAALAAEGESRIEGVQYLERGYEQLPERLRSLGAHVGLVSDEPMLAIAAD